MNDLEMEPLLAEAEDSPKDRGLSKGLGILARIIARQIDLSRQSRREAPDGEQDLEEED